MVGSTDFKNLHISYGKYSNFGASVDSMISHLFHNCCISKGKVHFLERPWIRHFRLNFNLLHVLANIYNFDADL